MDIDRMDRRFFSLLKKTLLTFSFLTLPLVGRIHENLVYENNKYSSVYMEESSNEDIFFDMKNINQRLVFNKSSLVDRMKVQPSKLNSILYSYYTKERLTQDNHSSTNNLVHLSKLDGELSIKKILEKTVLEENWIHYVDGEQWFEIGFGARFISDTSGHFVSRSNIDENKLDNIIKEIYGINHLAKISQYHYHPKRELILDSISSLRQHSEKYDWYQAYSFFNDDNRKKRKTFYKEMNSFLKYAFKDYPSARPSSADIACMFIEESKVAVNYPGMIFDHKIISQDGITTFRLSENSKKLYRENKFKSGVVYKSQIKGLSMCSIDNGGSIIISNDYLIIEFKRNN